MRISYASDLHHEFYKTPPKLEHNGGDLLVLAGDIQTVKSHSNDWWEETAVDFKNVIYIRGNHEYYGTYYTEYPDLWFPDNVIVVGRVPQIIDIEGTRILGGTMWTDLSNPMDEARAKGSMNDYRKIKHSRSRYWFTPQDTTTDFFTFREFLNDRAADIVITHHLPSYGSVPQHFRNDILNSAYATEMDIEGVKLWIHGHTHTPCDYVKQGCRVVANPKGYPGQNDPNYIAGVVEYATT